jgi:hypothetical protein
MSDVARISSVNLVSKLGVDTQQWQGSVRPSPQTRPLAQSKIWGSWLQLSPGIDAYGPDIQSTVVDWKDRLRSWHHAACVRQTVERSFVQYIDPRCIDIGIDLAETKNLCTRPSLSLLKLNNFENLKGIYSDLICVIIDHVWMIGCKLVWATRSTLWQILTIHASLK